MLDAVLMQLQQRFPEALVAIPSRDGPHEYSRDGLRLLRLVSAAKGPIDLNILQYLIPSMIRRALQRRGVVLEPDVTAFIDASGFAYGDQWSPYPIIRLYLRVLRSRIRGRSYVMLPQAYGPFRRPLDRVAMKAAIRRAEFVAVRDEESRAHLDSLEASANVDLYPDITIALRREPDEHKEGRVIVVPNSRMLRSISQELYLDLLASLTQLARDRGLRPVVMNHGGVSDVQICAATADRLGAELFSPSNGMQAKAALGGASLVISSRFHACVGALGQGVPCLATSWSHKYEQLFSDFGHPEWVINDAAEGDWSSLMDDALNVDRRSLMEVAGAMAVEVESMWQRVGLLLR